MIKYSNSNPIRKWMRAIDRIGQLTGTDIRCYFEDFLKYDRRKDWWAGPYRDYILIMDKHPEGYIRLVVEEHYTNSIIFDKVLPWYPELFKEYSTFKYQVEAEVVKHFVTGDYNVSLSIGNILYNYPTTSSETPPIRVWRSNTLTTHGNLIYIKTIEPLLDNSWKETLEFFLSGDKIVCIEKIW